MASTSKIWIEAWTLPGSALFERVRGPIFHKGLTYERKFRDFGSGSFTVGSHYASHLAIINPVLNVETLIRVFEDEVNVHEFFARSLDKDFSHDGDITISGPGIKDELDKVLVYPFDWAPTDLNVGARDTGTSRFPDTIYGGENLLQNPGFEEGILSEVQAIGHNFTGGSFTLTLGAETTGAIAWDASSEDVELALEAFTAIVDVDVQGSGEYGDPWRIEWVNPGQVAIGTLVLNSSLTGPSGSSFVVQVWQEGGAGSYYPWTKSINPVNGLEHGSYDGFRVAFDTEPEPVHSGSRSLKINLNPSGSFGGTQQGVDVIPGGIYQASAWIRTPDAGQTFVLGIRGATDESYISTSPPLLLSVNTWTEISIANVGIFPHISRINFRVACITPNSDVIFYVDDAEFMEGLAPTTAGQIVLNLRTTATFEGRDVLPWLDMTSFDGVNDSNGVPWINPEVHLTITAGMTWMQVFELLEDEGYEMDIRWDDAFGSYRLYLYNPLGQGTIKSADDFPKLAPPRVVTATIRKAAPAGAVVLAEGSNSLFLEGEDTVLEAAYGRREVFVHDSEAADLLTLQDVVDNKLDLFDAEKVGVKFNVDSSLRCGPGLELDVGDSVQVHVPGEFDPAVLRVYGFHTSVDSTMQVVRSVDVGRHIAREAFGGTTSSPTSAAVNFLLREFRRKARLKKGSTTIISGKGGEPTVVVAAADASANSIAKADFLCIGDDDHVTILAATAVCSSVGGGRVGLTEGIFHCEDALWSVPADVVIYGRGKNVTIIEVGGTGMITLLSKAWLKHLTVKRITPS